MGERRQQYSGGRDGGGINAGQGTYEIYNSLIYDNDKGTAGGAGINVYNNTANMQIHNSTIVGNKGGTPGGIDVRGPVVLYNSLLYHNIPSNYWNPSGYLAVTNSCTTPALSGWAAGNTVNPPQFADMEDKDFRLTPTSTGINAGTNLAWMTGAVDLDGNRRVDRASGQVDMGCYEYPFRLGTIISVR